MYFYRLVVPGHYNAIKSFDYFSRQNLKNILIEVCSEKSFATDNVTRAVLASRQSESTAALRDDLHGLREVTINDVQKYWLKMQDLCTLIRLKVD